MDAELAGDIYKSEPKQWEKAAQNLGFKTWPWKVDGKLTQELADELNIECIENDQKIPLLYDKKSGLTARVFHLPREQGEPEIRIAFGGTTSGPKTGTLVERALKNIMPTSKQWLSNSKNAVGHSVPKSSQLALAITEAMQKKIASGNDYSGHELVLTGHSKGAAEASYAAAMAGSKDKPMRAICFSSAELGLAARKAIEGKYGSPQSVEQAISLTKHIRVKGDPVSFASHIKIGNMTLGKLGLFGTRYTVAADPNGKKGPVAVHDGFREHIRAWAEQVQAEPGKS
jgi:hypothetical protein